MVPPRPVAEKGIPEEMRCIPIVQVICMVVPDHPNDTNEYKTCQTNPNASGDIPIVKGAERCIKGTEGLAAYR